jgi:hypothetical protein
VNKAYHSENQSKKQIDAPQERVAVVRSAHGRSDGTYCTSASFVYSSSGAKLLAGRHLTKRSASALTRNAEAHERATSNVRQFPPRTPRPTSPTHTRREAA